MSVQFGLRLGVVKRRLLQVEPLAFEVTFGRGDVIGGSLRGLQPLHLRLGVDDGLLVVLDCQAAALHTNVGGCEFQRGGSGLVGIVASDLVPVRKILRLVGRGLDNRHACRRVISDVLRVIRGVLERAIDLDDVVVVVGCGHVARFKGRLQSFFDPQQRAYTLIARVAKGVDELVRLALARFPFDRKQRVRDVVGRHLRVLRRVA